MTSGVEERRYFIPPLDRTYVQRASRCGKSAGIVAVEIAFRFRMSRGQPFSLCPKQVEGYGITRRTISRALRQLEDAGLIAITTCSGRCPVIHVKVDPTPRVRSKRVFSGR